MQALRADHISPLDMFKIGVGPSSSHTVGPMIAALNFVHNLAPDFLSQAALRIKVELYGSLAATGKGHYTDAAICAGLSGLHPKTADPDVIWAVMPALNEKKSFLVSNQTIAFHPDKDIAWLGWTFDDEPLPHPNTMRFRLYSQKSILHEATIISVGGGFIETLATNHPLGEKQNQFSAQAASPNLAANKFSNQEKPVPFPYNTAQEFIETCRKSNLAPWQVVVANEEALGRSEASLRANLLEIWQAMEFCIERGIKTEGILPGGLNVHRRAKKLYEQLLTGKTPGWAGNDLRPSVYAIAVNEENAAGGRVVTAPTNGSSGLLPGVFRFLKETENLSDESIVNGLITAAAIGAIVKVKASISGAEVGCQGEVGTSCAMAAAGAVTMLGGTPNQMEQAAEIAIEHHLGMTCDPIKGLVQVPCIERNAMGAVKALNACALSLSSDGSHLISLDRALEVMKQTGLDMNQKYKETSTGGLAIG